MTDYIVFESFAIGDWRELGKVNTSSAKAAIKDVLAGDKSTGGEFVAVPARSWQPVKVQVEQALKFS